MERKKSRYKYFTCSQSHLSLSQRPLSLSLSLLWGPFTLNSKRTRGKKNKKREKETSTFLGKQTHRFSIPKHLKMQHQRLKQQQQALMQQALLQQQSLYHPGLLAPPQVLFLSLSLFSIRLSIYLLFESLMRFRFVLRILCPLMLIVFEGFGSIAWARVRFL